MAEILGNITEYINGIVSVAAVCSISVGGLANTIPSNFVKQNADSFIWGGVMGYCIVKFATELVGIL